MRLAIIIVAMRVAIIIVAMRVAIISVATIAFIFNNAITLASIAPRKFAARAD